MALKKTPIEDTLESLQPLHLSIGATITSLLQNSGEKQCCSYD